MESDYGGEEAGCSLNEREVGVMSRHVDGGQADIGVVNAGDCYGVWSGGLSGPSEEGGAFPCVNTFSAASKKDG